jgi:putative cell wall-binding protein/Tol biopolymer transport system component
MVSSRGIRGTRRWGRLMLSAVLVCGLVVVLTPLQAAGLWTDALTTTRVSAPADGVTEMDRGAKGPELSEDGRYVAFATGKKLIASDTNGEIDVYVRDMMTGDLMLASVGDDESLGNDDAVSSDREGGPSISADGRYVAFASNADNLVPVDHSTGKGGRDIFVRDLESKTTTLVSGDDNGHEGGCRNPAISADGRFIAYQTERDVDPNDDNGDWDIYVYDMMTGDTVCASTDSDGDFWYSDSEHCDISGDGRYVVFESDNEYVAADDNGDQDIYMKDMQTGELHLLSVDENGQVDNEYSYYPQISTDASYVVFDSYAVLSSEDKNFDTKDVYGYDMATGKTELISVHLPFAVDWYRGSRSPSVSADGRFVAFFSGVQISETDNNENQDIYVYDRAIDAYTRLDVTRLIDDDTRNFALSGDGMWLGFDSDDNRITAGDNNGRKDVFLTEVRKVLPDGSLRLAGADRYETAIAISDAGFPDGTDTVVITTGEDWPDALSASALAGTVDCPILLTPSDALAPATRIEIERLGAENAYVIGGTGAVSAGVMSELESMLSGSVWRIGGADRYETSRLVALETIDLLGRQFDGTCLVATGMDYPDAVGASPLAAGLGWPIVMVDPMADEVATPFSVDSAVILGGTGAIPQWVEDDLRFEFGNSNVDRMAGADRYETSAMVAEHGFESGMRWNGVGITTGGAFPDALVGGVVLGRNGSVMLLTPSTTLAWPAKSKLMTYADAIDTVYFFGGTAAVSDAVKTAAESAVGM